MTARAQGGAGADDDDQQGFPIFRPGDGDMPETAQHNREAIQEKNLPFQLHFKRPRHDDRWRKTYARECNEDARQQRAEALGLTPAVLGCDEYPFASTEEGGLTNYLNGASIQAVVRGMAETQRGVSLKYVPIAEPQGQKLEAFYLDCGLIPSTNSDDSLFGVAPHPAGENKATDWSCGTRKKRR